MNTRQPDWQTADGAIQLYKGDALEVMPALKAGVADAVIADPPYGIDYQSARRTDSRLWKAKIANDTQPFVWWLHPCARVLSRPACCLCFCRWDVQEPFRLAMTWAGFDVKSQVVWDREAHGMGDLNGSPAPQHDVLWFGTMGPFKFHGSRPSTVVRSLRLGGEELKHPNQKPTGLLENLVHQYAPEGGTVLDPFMGSGTTGVACVMTGRRFIGIELEDKYFALSVKRIEQSVSERGLLTIMEGAA
jgi:DNA modification methylase